MEILSVYLGKKPKIHFTPHCEYGCHCAPRGYYSYEIRGVSFVCMTDLPATNRSETQRHIIQSTSKVIHPSVLFEVAYPVRISKLT
jgi:hypothetical protein